MSDGRLPAAPPPRDPSGPVPPPGRRWNLLAIASLVLGVLSFLLSWYGIIGVAAVVTGIIALRQIGATRQRGRWLAGAGVLLGALAVVIVIALVLIGRAAG